MKIGILVLLLFAVTVGGGCKSDSGDEESQPGERGQGVPSTWNDYCTEVGEAYCQREEQCAGADVKACMTAFAIGCCERDNACGSSFGAGISSEEYESCIDGTNDSQCGSKAPASCQALAKQSPQMSSDGPRSLTSACAGSCFAQGETNCPGLVPVSSCIDGCIKLPETFPACKDAWIALNTCMIDAALICDSVNGGAAVTSKDCGPEIDAFMKCS